MKKKFLERYSLAQSIFKICVMNQVNQKVTKYGLHKALSLSLGIETARSNL